MPKLQATETALVAEQRERVLTAVLKAWHDGEELTVADLRDRLDLDQTILVATLTALYNDGLVEQVPD